MNNPNQVILDKLEEILVESYGESLRDFGTSTAMAKAVYAGMEKYLAEQYR